MTKEAPTGVQRTLDLRELVQNATWRELLMELVESNSIDPWDIDIGKIANEYLQTIKKMQVMDLHIPANMTLAASILLRLKSDTMVMFQETYVEEEQGNAIARQLPVVPDLIPKFRMQPHRKISLSELMNALDDALKVTENRTLISSEMEAPMDFVVIKDDIDEKIASAYKLVSSNIGAEGAVGYSELAKMFGSERHAISDLFIPILFLAHKKELNISQSEFFGEIMISINPNKDQSEEDE